MIKNIATLLSIGVLSSAAFAQDYSTDEPTNRWAYQPQFSIGGGYGLTKLKDGDFDEDEAAKKAFAVFQINDYVGFEAAYIDFDRSANESLDFDVKGKSLGVLLALPISDAFSIYAKGGMLWWDADTRVNAVNFVTSSDYDGDETFFGAGAKFRLAEHLDLRVEYERFNFDISRDEINVLQPSDINMDIDYASVSLQYNF